MLESDSRVGVDKKWKPESESGVRVEKIKTFDLVTFIYFKNI